MKIPKLIAAVLLPCIGFAMALPAQAELTIDSATWDGKAVIVKGTGDKGDTVTVKNTFDLAQELGSKKVGGSRNWTVRANRPNPVPCSVTASAQGDTAVTEVVANAPANCGPNPNPVCNIVVSPISLDFGNVMVDTTSPPTQITTATNNGAAPCDVTVSETEGNTDFAAAPTNFILAADGGSQAVSVSYTPSAVGPDSGNLRVTSNDPDTPTVDVQLSGNGVAQPPVNTPPTCVIDTPQGDVSIATGSSVNYTSTVTDPDGDAVTIAWDFPGGAPPISDAEDPGSVVYNTAGVFHTTLDATDSQDATCQTQSVTITVTDQPNLPDVSINSTSQNCGQAGEPDCNSNIPVGEQPVPNNNNSLSPAAGTGTTGFQIVAINDLGMHCGDLDTRISSILPPFQVLLSQVIQKGSTPALVPHGTGPGQAEVFYSAASNPNDPATVLAGQPCTDTEGNAVPCVGVYKTNFWDAPIPAGSYDPFYPGGVGITPLATGGFPVTAGVGLPVPNVEELYIGADGVVDVNCDQTPNNCDGTLTAVQHDMPGIVAPYFNNDPQLVEEHYGDKPFFTNFPFGYVANDVNWQEGGGIPFAAYDDFGRENAYPLIRVQAKQGGANGNVVATVDTVLPISGEASCKNCHADPLDPNFGDSRTIQPTAALEVANLPVASSETDPQSGSVPIDVSVEWATDINVLRLHDLTHGSKYVAVGCSSEVAGSCTPTPCVINEANPNGDNASCLTYQALPPPTAPAGTDPKPVVCQVCHYTPALDLAQVGPLAGAAGTIPNGRNQLAHPSNSRVMHGHHGQFTDLFPAIPLPQQNAQGFVTNQAERVSAMNDSCYQCHPGTQVECLRGAMFNGAMLCSDCHGDMANVGEDFTKDVSPATPGPASFVFGGNFYDPTDSQPRVPWANEPDCGSCHTGNAKDNALTAGLVSDVANGGNAIVNTVDIYNNPDNIRLRVGYRVTGNGPTDGPADPKATPIVPINAQFGANPIPASFGNFTNPGAGPVGTTGAANPKLYRVSTGHGGVFCEGCHGATHAEWPNGDPDANDNVTSNQLQGHTGTVTECSTCHGAGWEPSLDQGLDGPHGMHVVGNTDFASGDHKDVNPRAECFTCHGGNSRNNSDGTVLSRAATTRTLETDNGTGNRTFQQGEAIGCADCHN